METRKWAFVVVGILLLILGTVFALQGAGVIGGSSLMSGNSTYIYVGAVIAIVGLILMALGVISKPKMSPALAGTAAAPSL